ncbi:unnamed protein product [Acanthoscelides obtectus]|uniref:Uncharacterized protein n=1 Tax=Acanthoscelides obtectus TaxID=200917 RepID=A0A9P0LZ16_ACAOB|nr:unnamed protein product [Acanthoscelides obtectus]CAK1669460.1 hypothetical protein AOBTE_LOCUS27016 [Acanthoscelides obtectus]
MTFIIFRSYIQQISTSVHTCYHMKLRNERSTAFVRNMPPWKTSWLIVTALPQVSSNGIVSAFIFGITPICNRQTLNSKRN